MLQCPLDEVMSFEVYGLRGFLYLSEVQRIEFGSIVMENSENSLKG